LPPMKRSRRGMCSATLWPALARQVRESPSLSSAGRRRLRPCTISRRVLTPYQKRSSTVSISYDGCASLKETAEDRAISVRRLTVFVAVHTMRGPDAIYPSRAGSELVISSRSIGCAVGYISARWPAHEGASERKRMKKVAEFGWAFPSSTQCA